MLYRTLNIILGKCHIWMIGIVLIGRKLQGSSNGNRHEWVANTDSKQNARCCRNRLSMDKHFEPTLSQMGLANLKEPTHCSEDSDFVTVKMHHDPAESIEMWKGIKGIQQRRRISNNNNNFNIHGISINWWNIRVIIH
jgi:hypothetical protein